jgi:hypothetical protein
MANGTQNDTEQHDKPDTQPDNQGVSSQDPAEGADDAPGRQEGSPEG